MPRLSLDKDVDTWLRDDPGHPLGGRSTGHTLREDGESHREAWMREIRRDPCSYCGGPGGTVDHVDHRRGPRVLHGLHGWPNYAGACVRCNESKSTEPMLLWLARRRVMRFSVVPNAVAHDVPAERPALGPDDGVVDQAA